MKDIALPTRMVTYLNNILDIFAIRNENSSIEAREAKAANTRQHRPERKDFFLFIQVIDCATQEVVGQLADISSGGFKLGGLNPVTLNKNFRFRLSLDSEISNKPSLEFVARSRWCRVDQADPYLYNVGYQLIDMAAGDLEIFNRMMQKYGREPKQRYRRPDAKAW